MIRGSAKVIRLALILGLALGLFMSAACKDESVPAAEPLTTAVADDPQPEETSPVAGEEAFSLAAANTAFAFDLYRQLVTEDGNLFFSPYSVSAALAMTLAGARGETADQIVEMLHFVTGEDAVDAAFADLDAALNGRGAVEAPFEGEGFDLHVVNAIWPQIGFALLDTFVDTVTTSYGAGLRTLDYLADPEAARATINDWVSEQTAEKIQDLLPQGTIDEGTRLVLTNAIYFNAPWLTPFDPEATTVEPFTLLGGETVDAQMMHLNESLGIAEWDGGIAVDLPYNGEDLSMLLLVPDEGAFETFDTSLSAEVFEGIVEDLSWRPVRLGLPRFEFEFAASLVQPLLALGMTDAFNDERADFSGITGSRDLVISDVLHKAFVAVDEAGTEAAAATAVVFRATGMPIEPIDVTIDRPFLFVIHDRPTGSVLFIGRVLEP